jgi:hypothetical protein
VSPEGWLIAILAVATPLGILGWSLVSADIFQVRNFNASLPALYLLIAAWIWQAPWRLLVAAVGSALVAFVLLAWSTLLPDSSRPAFREVAQAIEAEAAPGDIVYESTLVEGQPAQALAVHLDPTITRVRTSMPDAAARVRESAGDGAIWSVTYDWTAPSMRPEIPEGYKLVSTRTWPGIWYITLDRYEPVD